MGNNYVEFYLLNIKDLGNYMQIVILDTNGRPFSRRNIPIIGIKEKNSDLMRELFTGRYIDKTHNLIESGITYTESLLVDIEVMKEVSQLINLVRMGYDIKTGLDEAFKELWNKHDEEYREYMNEADKLVDFYFENMDEIYKKGRN